MSIVRMSNVNVETGFFRPILCVSNRIADAVAFVAAATSTLSEVSVTPKLQVGENKGCCNAEQDAKGPESNNNFPKHFHADEMGISRFTCKMGFGNNLFHARPQGIVKC